MVKSGMEATLNKKMEKNIKYLILLLVTTLSLTFASCSGDDEPDSPDDISTAGQLNTVTAKLVVDSHGVKEYEHVTVDVGCVIYVFLSSTTLENRFLEIDGGRIVYAGDFNQLSSIDTAPLNIDEYRSDYGIWHNGGCYIIRSDTGTYIRLKAEMNSDESAVTFKFQTYKPTNI